MATLHSIGISHLFTDQVLQNAFARIERDAPGALVVADRPKPVLTGGAAERILTDA